MSIFIKNDTIESETIKPRQMVNKNDGKHKPQILEFTMADGGCFEVDGQK